MFIKLINDKVIKIKNKKQFIIYTFLSLFLVMTFINIFLLVLFLKTTKNIDKNKLYNKITKSVVELKTFTKDYGENFGSAVFINDVGELITAAHVVTYKKANKVLTYQKFFIRFSHSEEFIEVRLLRYDIEKDLALLKVYINDKNNYKKTAISQNDIKSGDEVFAIGNGLNQGISIKQGMLQIQV